MNRYNLLTVIFVMYNSTLVIRSCLDSVCIRDFNYYKNLYFFRNEINPLKIAII